MIDHRLLKDHTHCLVAAEDVDRLPKKIRCKRLVSGFLTDSIDLMPVFIELDSLADEDHVQLLEQIYLDIESHESPLIKILFRSTKESSKVFNLLCNLQLCKGIRQKKAWLRIHDPRVWIHLNRVMNFHRYEVINEHFQRRTLFLNNDWFTENSILVEARNKAFKGNFINTMFGEDEWSAMENIGIINQVLQKLQINANAQVVKQSIQIEQNIADARKLFNLCTTNDLVEYAELCWNLHPNFHQHPLMVDAVTRYEQDIKLNSLNSVDINLLDVFKSVPKSSWQLIRQQTAIN